MIDSAHQRGPTHICPPPSGTETSRLAVIWILLPFLFNCIQQAVFKLKIAEARDAAFACNFGVLLSDGTFGAKERAERVKAQQ